MKTFCTRDIRIIIISYTVIYLLKVYLSTQTNNVYFFTNISLLEPLNIVMVVVVVVVAGPQLN